MADIGNPQTLGSHSAAKYKDCQMSLWKTGILFWGPKNYIYMNIY